MSWSYREHQKNILCMIMAGGQGSRLQPLTRDRAKPAVHFGGTYRIIDFVLNNFCFQACTILHLNNRTVEF